MPDNAINKDTGTLVGLGVVSDASTTNTLPGHVLLHVYRVKDLKIFGPAAGIESATLVYVLTQGPKPEIVATPKPTPDNPSTGM
jgi:hypothetical protein